MVPFSGYDNCGLLIASSVDLFCFSLGGGATGWIELPGHRRLRVCTRLLVCDQQQALIQLYRSVWEMIYGAMFFHRWKMNAEGPIVPGQKLIP